MKKFKNFNNYVTKIEKIGILCTWVITVILLVVILLRGTKKCLLKHYFKSYFKMDLSWSNRFLQVVEMNSIYSL